MAIDLQLAVSDEVVNLSQEIVQHWVAATFTAINRPMSDVTIRVVEEDEIIDLNRRFRGKNAPTNVLAFPFEAIRDIDYNSLGDIVICYSVVKDESNQQHKSVESHFAHMVIHGTLHLCGFDHQSDEEAAAMGAVEKDVLAATGYS